MKFTIDRFEGDFAVVELEDREMVDLPLSLLPENAKEGDILNITIDKNASEIRRKRIQDKFDSLFSD